MLTAFISYGGPDEKFAYQLNDALKEFGIKTFFFPIDAKAGEKLHRLMRDGVNSYDKVIFICSKDSLNRPGVINELEETLQRESREGGEQILIPISLDEYLFEQWHPLKSGLKQTLLDRVVGNFMGAKNNKKKFNLAFNKLLSSFGELPELSFLRFSSVIELDETGKHCRAKMERTFVAHKPTNQIVYFGLNTIGKILPISASFGKMEPMLDVGGNKTITVILDKPLPINKLVTHSIELEHIDAYTQETENHSVMQLSDCEEMKIDVIFPINRKVKTAELHCTHRGRTKILSDSLIINFDKSKVSATMKNPIKGAFYNLIWSW